MRLSWLEDLTKEGRFSPQQTASIYEKCGQLVKMAQTDEQAAMKFVQMLSPFVTAMAFTAAPLMVGAGLEYRKKVKNEATHREAHQRTMDSLLADPIMGGEHKDLMLRRFKEVADIAPTVAANGPLMTQILKKKLHSGFSHDDITGLAKIQATYSPNFGHQQELVPKYASEKASVRPEVVGEMTANSFLLCKEANLFNGKNMRFLGNAAKQTAFASAVPLLLATGTGIANSILSARNSRNQAAQLMNSYNLAMDPHHPGTSALNADPNKAREAFESLVHFAPHVAMQPTAARTFMNKIVEMDVTGRGSLQTPDLKELTDIERNLQGVPQVNAFFQGFVPALDTVGFKDSVTRSMNAFQDPMIHQMSMDAAKQLGFAYNDKRFESAKDVASRKRKDAAAEAREVSKGLRDAARSKMEMARGKRDQDRAKLEMARTMQSMGIKNKTEAKSVLKRMGLG